MVRYYLCKFCLSGGDQINLYALALLLKEYTLWVNSSSEYQGWDLPKSQEYAKNISSLLDVSEKISC